VSDEFVSRMEHLLDLYAKPYDPAEPVVCYDERPVQLLGEVREPIPAQPEQPAKHDFEYTRNGTTNLLLLVEPLAGWRDVEVSDQRTKIDFARRMKYLVDEQYPQADQIHVVLDNLNTHTLGALYEASPAPEAFRLAQKLHFHFTPNHGSWLNMAEIEISVMSRQCLAARIPDNDVLRSAVMPWQGARNDARAQIHWRFTVDSARVKLHRLYPDHPDQVMNQV
jgi:hypothetical protein